jgi:hypothetical protein
MVRSVNQPVLNRAGRSADAPGGPETVRRGRGRGRLRPSQWTVSSSPTARFTLSIARRPRLCRAEPWATNNGRRWIDLGHGSHLLVRFRLLPADRRCPSGRMAWAVAARSDDIPAIRGGTPLTLSRAGFHGSLDGRLPLGVSRRCSGWPSLVGRSVSERFQSGDVRCYVGGSGQCVLGDEPQDFRGKQLRHCLRICSRVNRARRLPASHGVGK